MSRRIYLTGVTNHLPQPLWSVYTYVRISGLNVGDLREDETR